MESWPPQPTPRSRLWCRSALFTGLTYQALENVLRSISAEYQLLQHSLVTCVHLVDGFVLLRLRLERNQRALHFDLIFAAGPFFFNDAAPPYNYAVSLHVALLL